MQRNSALRSEAYLNELGTGLDAVCFSLLVEEETAINYVAGKDEYLGRDLKLNLIKPLVSLKKCKLLACQSRLHKQ